MKTLEELYVDYKNMSFEEFMDILSINCADGGVFLKDFAAAYPEFKVDAQKNKELMKQWAKKYSARLEEMMKELQNDIVNFKKEIENKTV